MTALPAAPAGLLDILAITKDRPSSVIEFLDMLKRRLDLASGKYRVLVLDNGSTPPLREQLAAVTATPGVEWVESADNLGVCGGRNHLLARSQAPFVLEIDDDAEILTPDLADRVAQAFAAHPRLGVIAFKIVRNADNGEFVTKEYPFFNKKRPLEQAGQAAWFIGCAHVFRRAALEEVGVYGDFFPYGSEEQDLSLRLLDAGWDIYYDPQFAVIHRPAEAGRFQKRKDYASFALKQRWKAFFLNLPWIFLPFHVVIRGAVFIKGYRDWTVPFRALHLLWKERAYILTHRKPIKWKSIGLLLKLGGPVFF